MVRESHTLTCPQCAGTKRAHFDNPKNWAIAGYDPATSTVPCDNCGGQYQFEAPTGLVPPRRDNGERCLHAYTGRKIGNCLYEYTCTHCADRHTIDSGD
jgi:hypothetical protein